MITKEIQILNIVADYPETEDIFRSYDQVVGKCVLCQNLFDSLEVFANEYNIDLTDLIQKLNSKINLK